MWFNNPCFHIRNWKKFSESVICKNYFHDVLVFSESESFDNVIKCVQNHITTYNYENHLDTEAKNSINNYKKKFLDNFLIEENIDYNLPICFDPDKFKIENINLQLD